MKTVYISIGNSDNKLTQEQWFRFYSSVYGAIVRYASQRYGKWVSETVSPYQNACWCVEIDEANEIALKDVLRRYAREFKQDSIAWAEATTDFLSG